MGVWKGHSVSFLADKLRSQDNVKIFAVDLFEETYRWTEEEGQEAVSELREQVPYIYDIYQKVLEESKTRPLIEDIKGCSWEAAAQFEDDSVDFVFIDADHTYDSVKKDIEAWLPKVKKGGCISGHDYAPHAPGVIKAVQECFGTKFRAANGSVWFVKVESDDRS